MRYSRIDRRAVSFARFIVNRLADQSFSSTYRPPLYDANLQRPTRSVKYDSSYRVMRIIFRKLNYLHLWSGYMYAIFDIV